MVLQSIRDRLTGIIAIFIFAILIIPFAFVGVSSYFTSGAVNSVAVVNDKEITIGQYNQGFQNYRRRMQAQLGAAFDPELFDQPIIRRQFLDQLINEELLAQVSIDAGLAVDDAVLAQAIRDVEAFHVDGEFNVDVYQARLNSQGLTPKQFETNMRASMVLGQFPNAISNSSIATNWEKADYVRLMEQQRDFNAVMVPAFPAAAGPEETAETAAAEVTQESAGDTAAQEAAPEAVVEEEAIIEWYENNQGDYMSEERVIIDYIELDAATFGGAVEPDEEALRARFEEQQVRFITPEARLASHILIEVDQQAPQLELETARQQAEDLVALAREGGDFAELAREHSQDIGSASEGGDLGWIEPGFMVQAFEDGLYALTVENPVSEPIQTGFGWHVIYLREVRPSEGMTYTEAREILLAEYKAEADDRRFLEQADRMVDIIYEDPTTLSAAAEELGLEVGQAGPFGRAGSDFGPAANPDVVSAAFSDLVLAQSSVSDPIDLGVNHMVMILLREHLPQALLPLEEVRDQVTQSIRNQRAMEAARIKAEELLVSLDAGTEISTLAGTAGLELVEAQAALRTGTEVDARLLAKVFLLEKPDDSGPVTAVVELDDGYAVVQLNGVTDGELNPEDALRDQAYAQRIATSAASSETIGFLRMLRAQSTIEVFEDRL
jgi:peptidyl-prolyl cis-trans isomerase D